MTNSNNLNFFPSMDIGQILSNLPMQNWVFPMMLNLTTKPQLWMDWKRNSLVKVDFHSWFKLHRKKFVQIIIILQSIVFSHRNKSTRPHIRSFPIFCFYTKVIIGEVDQLQNYLQFLYRSHWTCLFKINLYYISEKCKFLRIQFDVASVVPQT